MGKKGSEKKKKRSAKKGGKAKPVKQKEMGTDIPKEVLQAQEESERLLSVATANGILRTTSPDEIKPNKQMQVLRVPLTLTHHCQGAPIKSQGTIKKINKTMFIFPGKIKPVLPGEKLGNLVKLNTPNPELHIDFPGRGRLRFRGTIIHPRTKYVQLQYPVGGGSEIKFGGVIGTIVVFPEYEWLGNEEENPERRSLPLPAWLAPPPKAGVALDKDVTTFDSEEDDKEEEKLPRAERPKRTINYKDLMPGVSDEELQNWIAEISESSDDELVFASKQTVAFDG